MPQIGIQRGISSGIFYFHGFPDMYMYSCNSRNDEHLLISKFLGDTILGIVQIPGIIDQI
jgi:hypothetical protein